MRISSLDVKLGVRMLRRYPGLSIISVIGMAVAIAIATGYYGAFGGMLDSKLPVPNGDRFVTIRNRDLASVGSKHEASVRDLATWREQARTLDELGAFRQLERNLIRDGGHTELVPVAAITANTFGMTGASPVLGRGLLAEDERMGAADVVVIGHDAWQHTFEAAPDILGRTIRLGDVVHTVVGVMPEGYGFPIKDQYWVPLRFDVGEYESNKATLIVYGRLKKGVSIEESRVELEAIGRRLRNEPNADPDVLPIVTPYTHAFVGIEGPEAEMAVRAVRLLMSVLLLIVAINISVLVYARTASRIGEVAVRSALGASRRRVVGQLFIEASVLAGTASVIGLLLAGFALNFGTKKLQSSYEVRYPYWLDLNLTPGVVLYVVALTLLACAIVGVLPALKVTSKQHDVLKDYGTRGAGLKLGRTWTALIVVQVAFAVAALPPALNYASNMLSVGMRSPVPVVSKLLHAFLVVPEGVEAKANELVHRLEAEPGVDGFTYATRYPGMEWGQKLEVDGVEMNAGRNDVAINLFQVFDAPIVAGRGFTEADAQQNAATAIVDETLAKELGGNVIGRRFRYLSDEPDAPPSPWYEIVGVVRNFGDDIKMEMGDPDPRVYHALGAIPAGATRVFVRLKGNPPAYMRKLTDFTAGVDPRLQLSDLSTVLELWKSDRTFYRAAGSGVSITMLSVLLLSAAGIYAMMSFTVARRRREIGIRAALGANARFVLAGIFGRAALQIGIGVAVGLGLAIAAEVVSPGLVFDGNGLVIVPSVIAVIFTVGLIAAFGPARRGLAVQPTEVLRDS